MSNRRKFLVVMAGTASLGVLSSIGRGVFNPSQAQDSCTIDDETPDVAKEGVRVIGEVGKATQALVSQVASASGGTITALSSEIEKASDAQIAFWSKSSNMARFVRSAAASEQKKAAQALKGRFSDKQIVEAVKKALANLQKNNISAIESDPIIGSVVKAGYVGVSKKMREAADRQKEIDALRENLRGKMAIRVEAEAVKLKKASKITNKDLQEIAKLYPSLAPSFKKALDINVQPVPGTKPPSSGIPVTPGLPKQQLKSDATRIDQSSLDTGNVVSGTSTSNQNRFDAYAQIIESRLSAVATPIDGGSDFTLVDRLLGIEKANACELICASVVLGIVAAAAVVAVIGIVAGSQADKNEACKELLLKQKQAEQVAACERRANERRRERLAAERRAFTQCKADFGLFGIFCAMGNALTKNDIESDYEKDVDACSLFLIYREFQVLGNHSIAVSDRTRYNRSLSAPALQSPPCTSYQRKPLYRSY